VGIRVKLDWIKNLFAKTEKQKKKGVYFGILFKGYNVKSALDITVHQKSLERRIFFEATY
jgi:hypothetical protein